MITRLYILAAGVIDPSRVNVPQGDLTNGSVRSGLQIFFGVAAAVAVVIIAISAIRIVISRGNSQDVTKARDAIVYAAVGLVITMSAFSIVTFVVDRI